MVVVVKVACPSCGEIQSVPAELTAVCPMCGIRLRAPASAMKHREPECQGIFHAVVVPLLLSASYLFIAYMLACFMVLAI